MIKISTVSKGQRQCSRLKLHVKCLYIKDLMQGMKQEKTKCTSSIPIQAQSQKPVSDQDRRYCRESQESVTPIAIMS
ncbi:Uncharacterized protein HZ326_3420 [Fusarium oxysporum f. sp. albedinis]|nr:Uncharacterized protein HZ326_3420 [Fusarium oxysporum f. sp. albedinis]